MHIGDSMTASHYCVQDKSHVSQLSQMSPFRHVNYGLSDDTLLRMQNRIKRCADSWLIIKVS
ncbi:hypothetical protein IDM30_09290 [Acinetobacter seifertii]|nr:hypothetical protein [Acinetobacter seifertii]